MALNENQITTAWERLISAETYALYFGSLAARCSARRQIVTFLSFFLSSGAAVTALSKSPAWVPTLLALAVAMATAYSVAAGLESKARTTTKLYNSWLALEQEYTRLWEETWADDAKDKLHALMHREQELSLLATTDAPNDGKALLKSQQQVFHMHHLAI